jgi:hypothetical protein
LALLGLRPRERNWQESPLIATEQEAERLRQAAFKERYESLIGGDA